MARVAREGDLLALISKVGITLLSLVNLNKPSNKSFPWSLRPFLPIVVCYDARRC